MKYLTLLGIAAALVAGIITVPAQNTAFTYQGRLHAGTNAANGFYDLRFTLHDALNGGGQQGNALTNVATSVSNGLFTVTLNFGGGVFNGANRWLEIGTRTNGNGAFVVLAPRQPLTPTPYAIFSGGASASGLSGTIGGGQIAPGAIGAIHLSNNVSLWNRLGANLYYANGNVGIGVTNPPTKLTVSQAAYGIEHTDGTRRLATYVDASGGYFGTASGDPLHFYVNDGGANLTVNTNGNVGIATTSPSERLHIEGNILANGSVFASGFVGVGTTNPATKFTVHEGTYGIEHTDGTRRLATYLDASGGYFGTVSTDPLHFYVNGGGASITVNTNENVGIGNTDPTTKLDVNGTVKATSFFGDGSGLTGIVATNASQLTSGTVPAAALDNAWKTGGNTGVMPDGFHFLGNIDNQPLEFWVNNRRSLRLEYANVGGITGVNTIGGALLNYAPPGQVLGTTIFGGSPNLNLSNSVLAFAAFSTISGGAGNVGLGQYSMIPGGLYNAATNFGFAAGRQAKARHDGSFVWADNTAADFASTGTNQFLIRASGGIGINTASPGSALDVAGGIRARGGAPGGFGANNNGYAFNGTGDTDSGLFSLADGQLSLFVNNSERVRLDSSGNVGIGTIVPGTKLHVVGSGFFGNDSGTLPASAGAGIRIFRDSTSGLGHIYAYNYATGSATNLILQQPGGNVGIGTTTPGTKLEVGGDITCTAVNLTSDRNAKEEFKPISAREVLAKVTQLPISEWQYKENPDTRHIGPMAQDFHAAFAVGRDDKHITSVDADGVALAAIQGLNEKLEEQVRDKDERIEELERAVAELKGLVKNLAATREGVAK